MAAILHNGLGRYADALAAAEQATQDAHLSVSTWALPELIEAAVRTGSTHAAPAALERLAETTQAGGTDFGLGLEARCRALLSRGDAADDLYREAIDRLGRTRLRPDLARAHLLYGEWLRREGRRVDARGQLRTAHDMFAAMGMEAFAERACRELIATGEKVRQRSAETRAGSRRRRSRSPGWPATAAPARRSAPSCSCPRARSNGTWARYLPSWASAPAGSCTPRWGAGKQDQPA